MKTARRPRPRRATFAAPARSIQAAAPRGANVASLPARPVRSGPLFAEQAIDPMLRWLMTTSDPDEILRKAGITRAALRVVLTDSEVQSLLDTRAEALIGTAWRLEGAESEALNFIWDEIAAWIEPLERCIFQAVPFGYSVGEIVFEVKDRGVGIGRFAEKPFEWFAPTQDGRLLWKTFQNPQGVEVDLRKYVLAVRNPTYRNPYGDALLSRAYWPWFFRSQGWKFWVKWLERFGTPLLVGMTSGDAEGMATALAKAVQDAAVAVGEGDEVVVVESGKGSDHFESFDRVVDGKMAKLILGQTLTSDAGGSSGKGGSYALGKVHNEVRLDRRNADIRLATRAIQRVVNTLWLLNGFSGPAPVFVLADDTGLEMDRAERDAKLVQARIVKLTEAYILRTYDFEPGDFEIPAEEAPEAIDPKTGLPVDKGGNKPGDKGKDKGEKKPPKVKAATGDDRPRFTPDQEVVESEVDRILREAESPIDPEEVMDCVRAATDAKDLGDRLAALWGDADTEAFQAVLSRALFAADLLGYVHAAK